MKNSKLYLILVIITALLHSCNKKDDLSDIDFRQEMRNFVIEISDYAHKTDSTFIIIPQNGAQLMAVSEDNLSPVQNYISAINGQGQEDLYYGYDSDDKATPEEVTNYLKQFLNLGKDNGVKILVTDYCSTHSNMDDSYAKNYSNGFISFAAPSRGLDVIPDYPATPYNENADDITTLSQAKNFLYLINPSNFATKDQLIEAIAATNYDVIIMDAFFDDQTPYTTEQIESLKTKANGGKRLVIAYMSIGEAEDYRYYWNPDWDKNPPQWLEGENPLWQGNYKVRYWDQDWKKIIYGTSDSYLDKILSYGFNGVYLDIIDAFEYFEEKYN